MEELSPEYYVQKPKLPTEAAIQNFIRGGADFNSMIDKGIHPNDANQKPVTKMADGQGSATLLTMLKHMNGVELLELLNMALALPRSEENVFKNQDGKTSTIPRKHVFSQLEEKQESQSTTLLDAGSTRNHMKTQPTVTRLKQDNVEPNNSNLNENHATDTSRQNSHLNTMQSIDTNIDTGSQNGYGINKAGNKISLTNEAKGPLPAKQTHSEEVKFQQNNGNFNPSATGSHTVNSGDAMNMYNSAQLNTNPMSMLSAGMGSSGSGSIGKTQYILPNENQISNTAEVSGFDPNRLMRSWTSTNGFNPAKYNVGQNFISADEWTRYANRQTGYTGIMQKLSQAPTRNQNPSNLQTSSLLDQKNSQSSSQTSSPNAIQNSALSAKMNFIPNSMILPNSKLSNMNLKLSFDPDRLNILQGTFHPGQFASVSNSNLGNSKQPQFDANAVNQQLMGLSDSGDHSMQNQPQAIQGAKKSGFQTPFNTAFNTGAMGFSHDLFLSPLSQYSKTHSQNSADTSTVAHNTKQRRSFYDFIELEANGDQNGSTSNVSANNVTAHTTIGPTATSTDQSMQTTTPSEKVGSYSGFDPDEINKPIMYNPGTLPGMSMGSFQYNSQQQQQSNANSTENKYAYLGFNPSQVNNAKMSFDINSQLGIDGKSQSFGGQAFTGGYDPMKTNIMAIQNPFAKNNDNSSQSFTAGTVSGYESAFVGNFNPNSINQGMMQTMINSKNENKTAGAGGYFGMGMGFDMSGYSGSFDPSSVNNAVFNPNEVNKVQMHFNPSEMLEKNPGYDADTALAYKFNPNHINNMQMHFQPSFLQNNNGAPSSVAANVTNSSTAIAGSGFVPGLLGGGNKNEIPIFNPDSVNNAHMHLAPIGVNNQAVTQTNNNQTSNTTAAPTEASTLFNPNNVNNAKMSLNPGGIVQSDSPQKTDRFKAASTSGLLEGVRVLLENSKGKEGTNESWLQLLLNNP